MLSKVFSGAVLGVDGYEVEIEVDVSRGLPATVVVGLPDAAVKESRDRVKAAVENSGFEHPVRRITVNLAPADVKKEGPGFDLPIAVGLLAASRQVAGERLGDFWLVGELALNGTVRSVRGVLPLAVAARRERRRGILVPSENAAEASIVEGLEVFPVRNLPEVVAFLSGERPIDPVRTDSSTAYGRCSRYEADLSDVRGQAHAKRALEVAVAGGHNLLMIGPPGSGKTMLARRIPTILPPMTLEEAIETTKVHSIMGLVPPGQPLIATRPFRNPHHTISDAGMVGGGTFPKPGEVSLSHNGVLFLDELPEFRRNVLEVLRQPLEAGEVTVSRATGSFTFPARFMLVAAMNPCPCGYYTDPRRECRCNPNQIQRYMGKVSGPLLDRVDIQVEVPPVPYREIADRTQGEPSAAVRQRVGPARAVQRVRFAKRGFYANASMSTRDIRHFCAPSREGADLLRMAVSELGMSARAYHRILKVARTIADLEGSDGISPHHISEAIQYRSLDRSLWV